MWDTLMAPGPEVAARYRAEGWWRRETYLDDLAHWAQVRPDHPAVIGYQGRRLERTLTYAELATMVARFAGALAELGMGPGMLWCPTCRTAGSSPRCTWLAAVWEPSRR